MQRACGAKVEQIARNLLGTKSPLVHSENGGEEGKCAVRGDDQDGEGYRYQTRTRVRTRGTASNQEGNGNVAHDDKEGAHQGGASRYQTTGETK